MTVLAAGGTSYVDLLFQGRQRVIATAVLRGPRGVALVDPGPSTTLPALRRGLEASGLAIADLQAILLTHIHLDHAGATGTLLAENPAIRVYVHEKGVPHLQDPHKLLESAARLYGAAMQSLWGEVLPVPATAIVALSGGEALEAGGRTWEVAYTPGHASHHVSYFNRDASLAFVGDTAGVRIGLDGPVLPPTPPPDVDLEAWQSSLATLAAWAPETLFLTHFGPFEPSQRHLAAVGEQLASVAAVAKALLAREEDDRARQGQFVEEVRRTIGRQVDAADLLAYETAAPLDLCWLGLARYWRKRPSTR